MQELMRSPGALETMLALDWSFYIPITSLFISSAEKTAEMTDSPRKPLFPAFPGLVKIRL